MDETSEKKGQESEAAKSVMRAQTFEGFDFDAVSTSLESLLKSGVHFGHLKSRLHPKMKPFVFTTRENINIIDLEQTQVMLERASVFLTGVAKAGKPLLFVGIKKHTHGLVRSLATECGEHFVTDRWLGGTLTNFPVVSKRATYLRETKERFDRGEYQMYTKLERQKILEELERLERKMGGIRYLRELPGALVIADAKNADLPIREARAVGIPVVAIADTNTDPSLVEYPVPANDDALSSLRLMLGAIGRVVRNAKRAAPVADQSKKKAEQKK